MFFADRIQAGNELLILLKNIMRNNIDNICVLAIP